MMVSVPVEVVDGCMGLVDESPVLITVVLLAILIVFTVMGFTP